MGLPRHFLSSFFPFIHFFLFLRLFVCFFCTTVVDGEVPANDSVNPLGDAIGIFYFGPDAEGPTKTVHGGAVATAADSIMGMCVSFCGMPRVTAKLEVDYRSLMPVPCYAIARARVHSRSGRKAVVLFDFRTLDGDTLYNEGWALFMTPKKHAPEEEKK